MDDPDYGEGITGCIVYAVLIIVVVISANLWLSGLIK